MVWNEAWARVRVGDCEREHLGGAFHVGIVG